MGTGVVYADITCGLQTQFSRVLFCLIPFIIIIDYALINAPALFSDNDVILTCINSCLLRMMWLSDMESTLKGKNLLL